MREKRPKVLKTGKCENPQCIYRLVEIDSKRASYQLSFNQGSTWIEMRVVNRRKK